MSKTVRALGALLVAMLTSVGLVVAAGPAQAATVDPRLEFVMTAAEYATWTPGGAVLEMAAQEAITASGLSGPAVSLVGSPAAVKAGTKVATRACRSPWGCVGVAAVFAGLTAWATSDIWLPWVPTLPPFLPSDDDLVSYFPQVGGYHCSKSLTAVDPHTWGTTNVVKIRWTNIASDWCVPGTSWAADCHLNGEWTHSTGTFYVPGNKAGTTYESSVSVCGSRELRRFHLTAAGATSTNRSFDRGFHWGPKAAPSPDTQISTEVSCTRPDGTHYSVYGSDLASSGVVAVPKCDPGHTPDWVEISSTPPGGTKQSESVFSPKAAQQIGTELYPLCVNGNCTWAVEYAGQQCAFGVAGCATWTTNKADARCLYGPYEMPIANCYWMERKYQYSTPTVPATRANTDGNPETSDGLTYVPVQPSPTPSTSTSVPGPSPSPSASTSVPAPSPSPSATTSVAAPARDPELDTPAGTPTPADPDLCSSPVAGLGQLSPTAVALVNDVSNRWPFAQGAIGGVRVDTGDHGKGLAVDFMTYSDSAKGQAIADYLRENAASLGVRYVIWEQKIWNIEYDAQGWRAMPDRGSPTENHMDHVHVSVNDGGGSIVSGARCFPPSEKSECWPSGYGVFNPASWVLQPIKCAIEWAVIPPDIRSGAITWGGYFDAKYQAVMDKALEPPPMPQGRMFARGLDPGTGGTDNAPPMGKWAAEFKSLNGAFVRGVSDSETCRGPGVDVGRFPALVTVAGGSTLYPFQACSGLAATMADTSQMLISVFILWGTWWRSLRLMASSIGYDISAITSTSGAHVALDDEFRKGKLL